MKRLLTIAGAALLAAGCQAPDPTVECAKLAAGAKAVIANDAKPRPRFDPFATYSDRLGFYSDGHLDQPLRELGDPYARRLGVPDPFAFCKELSGQSPLGDAPSPYRHN